MIEVFADVSCPFAHIGLRTVAVRKTMLGHAGVVVRVRAWPLELVNRQPLDAAKTAEHIEDIREQVDASLFSGFDVTSFPVTSLPALALTAAAYRRDDVTGEAISFALRDALFEQGQDISNPAVLRRIAAAHGAPEVTPADEESVRADWAEGKRRNVEGSPHFFCGDAEAFCPSLDITSTDGTLHIARNLDALDAFLGSCWD